MFESLLNNLPIENNEERWSDIIVDYIKELLGIMRTKKGIEQFQALEQFRIKYNLNTPDIIVLVKVVEKLDK